MSILSYLKQEDHRRAFYASLVFIMLMILFFFLVSLEEPDPPIKEVIIEIEMPDVEIESGGSSAGSNDQPEEATTPEVKTVQQSAPKIEQQEEATVSVPSGSGNSKTTKTTKVAEPKPDASFTFSGGTGNNGQTGDGDNFGKGTGVVDSEGDGPDATGKYNPNRKVVKGADINSNAQEEGIIALDIWVDASGKVVRTRLKATESTSGSDYLITLAKKAAASMKYDSKPGSGEEHVGYKRFHFKKV